MAYHIIAIEPREVLASIHLAPACPEEFRTLCQGNDATHNGLGQLTTKTLTYAQT